MKVVRTRGEGSLLLAFTAAVGLVALLAAAVGSTDDRERRELRIPGVSAAVEPGRALDLELAGALRTSRTYRLTVVCAAGHPCARLRVGAGSGVVGRAPDGVNGDTAYFDLAALELGAGVLRLANDGAAPVAAVRATLRNHVAANGRPPRFVVFLGGPSRGRYSWPALTVLFVAGLGLQLSGLVTWMGRVPARLAPWIVGSVVAPPLAALGAALALRAGGFELALGWDAFLLLCGLPVVVRGLVAAPGAAVRLGRLARSEQLARVARTVLGSLPWLFPALVLFVHLPLSIYLPNQPEFNYHLWRLLPFGIALAVWLVAGSALACWKSPRRDPLVKILFLFGLLVLVLDLVTPIDIEPLDGRPIAELLRVSPAAPWVEGAVLAAVVLFGVTVTWAQIRVLAGLVTVAMLVFLGVSVATGLSPETNYSASVRTRAKWSQPAPAVPSTNGNVYHVILDAFSSQVFLDIVHRQSLESLFEGFTFFANARANFLATHESMPSFMTGTLLPPKAPGTSDQEWWYRDVRSWRARCTREGILDHAYGQGYTITQYVPIVKWCPHVRTTHFRIGADLQRTNRAFASFVDLWLLRITPAPWKLWPFGDGSRGVVERLLGQPGDHEWGFWSVPHMDQLVSDEAARPPHGQYVWAHFGIPHTPSVVDADCNYVGGRWKRDYAAGYRDQATCALRLAGRLVEALKRLGRFDEATILVHSDHALDPFDGTSDVNRMPAPFAAMIDAEAKTEGRGRAINNRSLALLLVKPPRAPRAPLRIDERRVSLVDLPQTVYELQGWPARSPDGRSVFRDSEREPREVHLFTQFAGQQRWHFIIDGATWRMAPDSPVRIQ